MSDEEEEKAPQYAVDADTLARWLIIQCGSVREARKVVTRNKDAARSRRRSKVPPLVILLAAAQIQKSKPSYRGGQMSRFTAIQHAAKRLLKNKYDIAAAVQAARRMMKNGHWPLDTK